MSTFRIAIARTGQFTDSQGRPQSFSESDLDAVVAGYDPARLEAPLVFGHPRDADPAFGWVKSLQREGKTLFAQLAQVPDSVRKLVQDGRYKYVSMSLTPDRKRLRHVGLLGAAAPAIDGLAPVSLRDGLAPVSLAEDTDSVTVEFAAPEPSKEGAPMPTVEELQAKIRELEAENAKLKGEKDGAEGKKAEAEKKAADTAAEFAAFKHGVTVKTREARMDALVKAGKVRPAERNKYLNLTASLAKSGDSHDFAAPDGTVQKVSAEEQLFRDLESREPCGLDVNFAAFSEPGHAAQRQPVAVNLADVTAKL